MPFYGWCRTLSPLGLVLNVRYAFDASLPIPARVACAVIATILLGLLTYYVVRVERDYQGARAILRDATKRAEDASKMLRISNQQCSAAVERLDATEARYREFMKSEAR